MYWPPSAISAWTITPSGGAVHRPGLEPEGFLKECHRFLAVVVAEHRVEALDLRISHGRRRYGLQQLSVPTPFARYNTDFTDAIVALGLTL